MALSFFWVMFVFELGGDLRFGLGGLLLLFNGFNDSLFGREKIEGGFVGAQVKGFQVFSTLDGGSK